MNERVISIQTVDGCWPLKVRRTVASYVAAAGRMGREGEFTVEALLKLEAGLLEELAVPVPPGAS